jgi:hypothetical protein
MKNEKERVKVVILSTPEVQDFTARKEELQQAGYNLGKTARVWKKYFWERPKKAYFYYEGFKDPLTDPQQSGDLDKTKQDRAMSALLFGAFQSELEQKGKAAAERKSDRVPLLLIFIALLVSIGFNFYMLYLIMGVVGA